MAKTAKIKNLESETDLQIMCTSWFDLCYKQYKELLIHVPNGGMRPKRSVYSKKLGKVIQVSNEGRKLKAMATRSGVSDHLFLLPLLNPDILPYYNLLCIEFKTDIGVQSEDQKKFAQAVEKYGHRYIIVKSFDEYRNAIWDHLGQNIGQKFILKNPEYDRNTKKIRNY